MVIRRIYKHVNGLKIKIPEEYYPFGAEQQHASRDYNLAMQKINNERMKLSRDRDLQLKNLDMEKQKLKIKQEEIKSRERIAHINKNKFD